MNDSRNIRLTLRYDGTNYRGWQSQAGAGTIQDILEEKIGVMTGGSVRVIGAGRTDAGVHALHQVCHFHTASRIESESLRRGLNSLLPPDIFVSAAENAPADFHARYSAKNKTYEYRILNRPAPDPFLRLYTWHLRSPLDLPEMEKCLSPLLGRHDFSSFMSSGSSVRSPIRTMMRAQMHSPGEGLLYFEFQADGFLRHMIRNIVGTLVEVGKGRWNSGDFLGIFRARDRCEAGMKAPAQGLFLKAIAYEDDRDLGFEMDSASESRTEA